MGEVKPQMLILLLGGCKFKILAGASSAPGESLCLVCPAANLLCPHEEERENALLSSSSHKEPNPILGTPPSRGVPHLNLIKTQMSHL